MVRRHPSVSSHSEHRLSNGNVENVASGEIKGDLCDLCDSPGQGNGELVLCAGEEGEGESCSMQCVCVCAGEEEEEESCSSQDSFHSTVENMDKDSFLVNLDLPTTTYLYASPLPPQLTQPGQASCQLYWTGVAMVNQGLVECRKIR